MSSGFVPHPGMFTSSQPSTPSAYASEPTFDFSIPPMPSIPPRLSKVGRRISELGSSFLNPEYDLTPDAQPQSSSSSQKDEVWGMGDDPVMCPFCNKPLPPMLFDRPDKHNHSQAHTQGQAQAQIATGAQTPKRGSLDIVRGFAANSSPVSRKPSLPRTMSARTSIASSLLTASLPPPSASGPINPSTVVSTSSATTPSLTAIPPQPKATAETFGPGVQTAERADGLAVKSLISPAELARWSQVAGVSPASSSSTAAPVTSATQTATPQVSAAPSKPIPALPPPPPPAGKLLKTERSSSSTSTASKFSFFRRGSKPKEPEDDDSDDDHSTPMGYAKLMAPGSPDVDEGEGKKPKKLSIGAVADVAPNAVVEPEKGKDLAEQPTSATCSSEGKKDATAAAGDEEIRKTLQEVVGKVDSMSKAHTELLASHATLLTLLKIAKSNLAMAEANTDMLEEQLTRAKAAQPAAIKPAPVVTPIAASSAPGASLAKSASAAGTAIPIAAPPGGPAPAASASLPTTLPAAPSSAPDLNSSLDAQANALVSAAVARSPGVAPLTATSTGAKPMRSSLEQSRPTPAKATSGRKSVEDKPRPMSLQMPAPNPLNNGPATATPDTKGWGFWQGGKKKLPGGLGSFTLPTPAQVAAALDTSRPPTPDTERTRFNFPPSPVNSNSSTSPRFQNMQSPPQGSGPRVDGSAPLTRSSTMHSSPASALSPSGASRATLPNQPTHVSELTRLRQANIAAHTRMDNMNKELAELKRGKVEMEAELENLSQALFEEANKMVADERKRRAELEESLKEVKEEREALRQTIKVLGGSVGDVSASEGTASPSEVDLPEEFVPRDLDKHYEALRKTIHHVADGAGADTTPEAMFGEAMQSHTPESGEADGEDEADNAGVRLRSARASAGTMFSEDYSLDGGEGDGDITIVGPSAVDLDEDPGSSPPKLRRFSLSAPVSPNPWAEAEMQQAPVSLGALGAVPQMHLQAPTPGDVTPMPSPGDIAGEGEAPALKGLAIDLEGVRKAMDEQEIEEAQGVAKAAEAETE